MVNTDISFNDLIDPTKTLDLSVERFDPNTNTWVFDSGFTWVGGQPLAKRGTFLSPGGATSMGFPDVISGQMIRIVATSPTPLHIGFAAGVY